eukprot:s486_g11.t1
MKPQWISSFSQEVFRMVDHFMQQAASYVKVFIFDGEGCNGVLRQVVHGTASATLKRRVLNTDFFSQLRHVEVQGFECLPRNPLMHCLTGTGRALYALCAPAHAMKNAAGQVMSSGRVLFYGEHYADASGALSNGLPMPAFSRKDAMSDRLCALLCNPMFVIRDADTCYLMISYVFKFSNAFKSAQEFS